MAKRPLPPDALLPAVRASLRPRPLKYQPPKKRMLRKRGRRPRRTSFAAWLDEVVAAGHPEVLVLTPSEQTAAFEAARKGFGWGTRGHGWVGRSARGKPGIRKTTKPQKKKKAAR